MSYYVSAPHYGGATSSFWRSSASSSHRTIHKLFVSPTPRGALVLGKALAAGVRSLSQVAIVYTLAWLLGVGVNGSPLALLGVAVAVLIGQPVSRRSR